MAMTPFMTGFLASLVEGVEALTVILAVGAVRGWRGALQGTVLALGLLAAIVLVFGSLLARLPLRPLQVAIGGFILLFGLRWLRKAALRMAGVIPLHDEAAAYDRQVRTLRTATHAGGWDAVAIATSFKIVMVEGIEVVLVVLALGANRAGLYPAAYGALAALVTVCVLGLALRRPIERLPENAVKFAVGVLLCAFGTFWVGEGLGLTWPGGDIALAGLCGFFTLLGLIGARINRTT